MPRTPGAKNVVSLENRKSIETSASKAISHLAQIAGSKPIDQFRAIVNHQHNFLKWIDSRHYELLDAKRKLDPNGRGPKDAVYRKYKWYAAQTSLLEAINALEVFYKSTFIGLATAIKEAVPADRIRGNVDSKVIWTTRKGASLTALIFEQQLYHNLENVDQASSMLVGAKRYQPSNLQNPIRNRVLALQAAFQIRHTLAHNHGRVTQSDRAKYLALGYDVKKGEVIDPTSKHLARAITDTLWCEAEDYTNWLLERCAAYLKTRNEREGLVLKSHWRAGIQGNVGNHADIESLPWV